MRLDLPDRRRGRLSMTSLIDVIFLLLLFFMMSSTFSRFSSLEIGAAGAGQGSGGAAPDILISLRADGLLLNGAPVEDLAAALVAAKGEGAQKAAILAGVGATSQQLVDALEASRSAGIDAAVAR